MNTECDKRIGTYLLESRTNKERDGLAFCGWLDPQCGPLHMSHLRLEVCGGHLVGLDFRDIILEIRSNFISISLFVLHS